MDSVSNIVTRVNPDSRMLFMMFMGNRDAMGLPPVEFIRITGIGAANFMTFRDPYKAGYQKGVSPEHNSLERLTDLTRALIAEKFPHAKDVYCIGNSGGGSGALHVGYHLGVKAVFSIAGLIPNPASVAARQQGKRDFVKRFLGREELGKPTPQETALLIQAHSHPDVVRWAEEVDENPAVLLNHTLMTELVTLLRDHPKATQFHFYYAVTNRLDRLVAESFANCPNTTLYPIMPSWGEAPPPHWSRLIAGAPDHNVAGILQGKHQLKSLFHGKL